MLRDTENIIGILYDDRLVILRKIKNMWDYSGVIYKPFELEYICDHLHRLNFIWVYTSKYSISIDNIYGVWNEN